jgi:hypothetical protein
VAPVFVFDVIDLPHLAFEADQHVSCDPNLVRDPQSQLDRLGDLVRLVKFLAAQ